MAYRKAHRSKYNKKQRGGGDLRPRGRIKRGSGTPDTTSPINAATGQHYTVDDVPALLGANEFVVNSQAAQAVGYNFLEKINNIGTNNSNQFSKGTLTQHGSNYQKGGRVRKQMGGGNGQCGPNQHWMPSVNGQPGYCMEGKTHVGSGYQNGGKINNNTRRNTMRQGGRTRSAPRGRAMARGGRARPVSRRMGGRTRPVSRSMGGRSRMSNLGIPCPGFTCWDGTCVSEDANCPLRPITKQMCGPRGYDPKNIKCRGQATGQSTYSRGGRTRPVRRQMGGQGSNLPIPWGSH